MQSFPLKFPDRLERSNADRHHQTDIVFDFKTVCMCPTGSVTMRHCILIVEWRRNGNLILTATVRNIQCRLFTVICRRARLQTPRYIHLCDTMVCALYHMCTYNNMAYHIQAVVAKAGRGDLEVMFIQCLSTAGHNHRYLLQSKSHSHVQLMCKQTTTERFMRVHISTKATSVTYTTYGESIPLSLNYWCCHLWHKITPA